jgi:PAS domain S-box-containing protein
LNLKKKNGSPITASFSTVAVKNKKGKILYHDGIIEDITERKQMEQKLRESQKRYETLTESSPVGVFHADAKGDCTYVNNRWVSIAGLPPEGARHKGWMKALHPEDKKRVSAEWHQSCQEKKPFSSEFRFQRPDGTTAWVFSLAAPEENTEGEVTSYVGTVTDITGLKMAEEQIKTSLREKEVLLQEVHHRVKNNMQVMSSLFNLQSQQIKDKRSLEMFKSMQNRVRSIALIHERLYQAKNYTRVNFAEYIQGLTKHLFSVYGIDSNKINLKLNIEDVFLDINTAIPCGLIINELATNAIKHAFPNGEKGEIKIDMHPVDSKEVELIIADDGVGTAKSVDPKSPESLGLHLVTLLAESQLQGEIKLDRNKGTRFRIKFKVKK